MALVALLACATVLYGKPECSGQSPDGVKKQMAEFFTGRLAGEKGVFEDPSPVALADIEQERKAVWEAWKEANDGFEEEKLIALEGLASKKSGSWKLPEELEAGAVMPYYWGAKGEKPGNGYPLYLYLHGSGPKAHEWSAGITLAQRFNDAPSAYFIPQIPNEKQYRWYPRSKQYAWEKLLRLALLSGEVDPNAVYFFGISEGGYGSQRMASFYADYLAGAGPMAAGEPLKNAPAENCRNTAFSLRTGANDAGFYRNTLTRYTQEEFDRLQAASPNGFVHQVELVPDQGHGFDYSVNTPWLRQYTRNPHPRFVSWENMEMDGRYREGFYNLLVNERSNGDESERTYYEMEIDGNDISLRVDLATYEVTEKDPRWGIEMKFAKSYTPATQGKVTIYLSGELVDLDKKITVSVNGKPAFRGKVACERRHLVNSCAAFFDPERLYPAAVEIDLSEL
jgi:predicted esterase